MLFNSSREDLPACRSESGNPGKELHETQLPSPENLRGHPGLRIPVRPPQPRIPHSHEERPCSEHTESLQVRVLTAVESQKVSLPLSHSRLSPGHTELTPGGRDSLTHHPSLILHLCADLTQYFEKQRGRPSPLRLEGDSTISMHRREQRSPRARGVGSAVRDRRPREPLYP